jgi:hypothetical protein
MFFKAGSFIHPIPETETYKARLSGTIASGNSALKTVWVYDRDTGKLLGQTAMESDGTWELNIQARAAQSLMVVCRDEGGDYNADVYDRVSQCTDVILEESEYTAEFFIADPKVYQLPNTRHVNNHMLPIPANTATPVSFNLTMTDGVVSCPDYLEGVYTFYDQDSRWFYGYC